MQIGISTFGDVPAASRNPGLTARRLAEVVEEAVLAEQVGLDVFAVGEHHRADYAISAPAVVLAAIASRTHTIRLSSAVTVLSSDDPVRVFEEFATLDLLSGGRAEIMAGRGSFTESFPLFGQHLDDYDALFAEKLDLLLQIRSGNPISWAGRFRPSLDHQSIFPRPVQQPLPVWVAVGGSPASVVRAAQLGLPLTLAIIGGMPARFAPMIALYRASAARAGRDPATLQVGINSHTWVGDTAETAAAEFYPSYSERMSRIGAERGWPPASRSQFDAMCSPEGALLVGSPQQVIDKILMEHELFRHDRFLAQVGVGDNPHRGIMRTIELLGTVVKPAIERAMYGT
jgi:probable LLM family oxidoreductase